MNTTTCRRCNKEARCYRCYQYLASVNPRKRWRAVRLVGGVSGWDVGEDKRVYENDREVGLDECEKEGFKEMM